MKVIDTLTEALVLATEYLVWSFSTKKYYASNNENDIKELTKEGGNYCESIINGNVQKFYLDFDIKRGDTVIKSDCDQLIRDSISIVQDQTLSGKTYVVYTSHTDIKYSYHVIFTDLFFNNVHQMKYLANIIKNELNTSYLDTTLYKSAQLFRIPYNRKVGGMIKTIDEDMSSDFESDDYFKHWIGCNYDDVPIFEFGDISFEDKNVSNTLVEITTEDRKIADLFKPHHTIRSVVSVGKHKKIIFNRVSASHCSLCDRIHDSDNTLIIYTYNYKNKTKYIEYCRKNISEKEVPNINKYIYEDVEDGVKHAKLQHTISKPYNKPNLITTPKKYILDNNKFLKSFKEIFDHFGMYNKPTILCIRAPMKIGKSKFLREYIDSIASFNPSILVISFRILFTLEFKSKNHDFINYQDIKGDIDFQRYKRVICQLDSFQRLNLSKGFPQMIVMDESESILQHMSTLPMDKFTTIWQIFQLLIKYAEKAICMDAYLNDRTLSVMNLIKGNKELIMYHNKSKTAVADDVYNIYTNRTQWYRLLIKDILLGKKKVVIPTTSLKEAHTIANVLRSPDLMTLCDNDNVLETYIEYLLGNPISLETNDLKIMIYTSETHQKIKKAHLSNVNINWSKYDVIIYTPCITSGVSYEIQDYFDCIYANFSNNSCDLLSMIQMLGRTRSVKVFHILLTAFNEPTCAIFNKKDIMDPNKPELISYILNEYDSFDIKLKILKDKKIVPVSVTDADQFSVAYQAMYVDDILINENPIYLLIYYSKLFEFYKREYFYDMFITYLLDSTINIQNLIIPKKEGYSMLTNSKIMKAKIEEYAFRLLKLIKIDEPYQLWPHNNLESQEEINKYLIKTNYLSMYSFKHTFTNPSEFHKKCIASIYGELISFDESKDDIIDQICGMTELHFNISKLEVMPLYQLGILHALLTEYVNEDDIIKSIICDGLLNKKIKQDSQHRMYEIVYDETNVYSPDIFNNIAIKKRLMKFDNFSDNWYKGTLGEHNDSLSIISQTLYKINYKRSHDIIMLPDLESYVKTNIVTTMEKYFGIYKTYDEIKEVSPEISKFLHIVNNVLSKLFKIELDYKNYDGKIGYTQRNLSIWRIDTDKNLRIDTTKSINNNI